MPLALFEPDADVLVIVLSIAFLVLSLSVHEWAHAWSAWKLGDPTAKDEGRLTINPIVHIDLWWTIVLPGLLMLSGLPAFGGAKPVPVDMHRLRKPWRDMTLVALAGPFSNLVLALLFLLAWVFFVRTGLYNDAGRDMYERTADLLPRVLSAAAISNVVLCVFNMIPIPPLDGSRLMEHVLPRNLRDSYMALGSFGFILVFLALQFVPPFRAAYSSTVMALYQALKSLAVSIGG